ncbi:MAG TPA: DUF1634 domain-containing protein [Terriglobales bacterium]|nr:DUF1634 domain-containing protein [Terriglobales bacterium]
MTVIREPGFDKAVARVLRIGAFAGFAIMLAGVVGGIFDHSVVSRRIEIIGVEVMLITPLVRVFTSFILFTHEKDWRYSAISFGVLLMLLLGAVFGIGEH